MLFFCCWQQTELKSVSTEGTFFPLRSHIPNTWQILSDWLPTWATKEKKERIVFVLLSNYYLELFWNGSLPPFLCVSNSRWQKCNCILGLGGHTTKCGEQNSLLAAGVSPKSWQQSFSHNPFSESSCSIILGGVQGYGIKICGYNANWFRLA